MHPITEHCTPSNRIYVYSLSLPFCYYIRINTTQHHTTRTCIHTHTHDPPNPPPPPCPCSATVPQENGSRASRSWRANWAASPSTSPALISSPARCSSSSSSNTTNGRCPPLHFAVPLQRHAAAIDGRRWQWRPRIGGQCPQAQVGPLAAGQPGGQCGIWLGISSNSNGGSSSSCLLLLLAHGSQPPAAAD